jgi:hypothetical protein
MGRAKQLIIAEQEQSSMASTWTEYLVLERRAKTKDWRLFVGKYEVLAECWDYFNDETQDFDLPKSIQRNKVVGIEDGWVIGGPLQAWDHPEISFFEINDDVVAYINEYWSIPLDALAELDRIVNRLGELTLIRAFEGGEGRFNLWLDATTKQPTLKLRQALAAPKKKPPIFSAGASNSRKFLNAIRSAWYLMLRRDVTEEEVGSIAWLVRDRMPSLAKKMVPMFKKMLGERVIEGGEVVKVGSDASDLPRVLFVAKHVFVTEGQPRETSFLRPPPLFRVSYRHDGRSIGDLCWVEGGRFRGAGSYGSHDLPFSAATLQELADEALKTEEWILSTS